MNCSAEDLSNCDSDRQSADSSFRPTKQWDELRQEIRKSKKLAQTTTCRVPMNFTFRHVHTSTGHIVRLYFLGMPPGHRENTLLYVDLPAEIKPESELLEVLEWNHLLDAFHAMPSHGQYSKEEQLMRERRRMGSFGITTYDYNASHGSFVFPACNSLYLVNDFLVNGALQCRPRFPNECRSSCTSTRLDPKLCPYNPELLAFVSRGDIWITHLASGQEHKITNTSNGSDNLKENPISAGLPSFVMQEEFDRYTGYWWQPCTTKDNQYIILYEEVDESDVQIININSASQESSEEYRYPRAGTSNARSTLKVLQFTLQPNGAISDIVERCMVEPLSVLFPDTEYIPHIGWHPSGKCFYAQLLNRRQQRLQLVLIQLSYMSRLSDGTILEQYRHQKLKIEPVQLLLEETSTLWINTCDTIRFLLNSSSSLDEISFIWTSERSGYRHLYHVTSTLTKPLLDNEDLSTHMCIDQIQPNINRDVPLTSGDWSVTDKQICVDEANKLVYFTGRKDTPLETHLYCVSYHEPGEIVRLTQPGFSHSVTLDERCSIFVTMYSSIDKTPGCQIYQVTATQDKGTLVTVTATATLLSRTEPSPDFSPPELFDFVNSSGHCIYGMVYSPHDHLPDQKYPTVLYVYGGPQVQMVSNIYKGIRFLRLHTLASLGYAVVVIDSRGSCCRGMEFESYLQDKLGQIEIQDQVEGLQYLAERVSYIDMDRVAIHGWSYGGFLSLMGLTQRPDIFKMAIAGAPVVLWSLYDTAYTERYIGLPYDNPQNYEKSSVLHQIEKFPAEPSRLLIIHGLIDENVHFSHTLSLISALLKAVKPYQLQVFPGERHGIRSSNEHYETTVLSFLEQNL